MTQQSIAPFDLEGKIAIVTGGASGIGAGIASVLSKSGASVAVLDINLDAAKHHAESLNTHGRVAHAFHVDLSDESSIVSCCNEVAAKFGTPWVLVNNAGIQDRELLLEGTAQEWDRMNKVNGRGAFLMTREAARMMVSRGQGGRIINIASVSLVGGMIKGLAPYMASKGALLALSQASAFELAEHGITVNTVLPGGVATPGAIEAKGPAPDGPARRRPPLGMCEPSDIGAAVLFFSTPAAARITNQSLVVDGGFTVT